MILNQGKNHMADQRVDEAIELFKEAKEYWADIRNAASEDLEFIDAKAQWSEDDKASRARDNRPALTINRLPQFIHQITNEMRQNTPSIKCLPMGEGSDEDVAEIWQGIIRNIEYISRADIAYDTAGEYAVKCGIGYFRLDHDYINGNGFEQHVLIRPVHDPLSIMLDHDSMEIDGSDAKFAFAVTEMSRKAFEKKFGKTAVGFADERDASMQKDTAKVAEFFKMDEKLEEMALLENGDVVPVSKVPQGFPLLRTRKIKQNKIIRLKMTGNEIIEETTFPGQYIPIIPVYGEVQYTKGKRCVYSLVRFAKDPQRLYNYWKSEEAEYLRMGKEAPWVMAEGQAQGHEHGWKNPTGKRVLFYKQTDVDGNPAPAPQRQSPTPIPSGVLQASAGTIDDMKATMGIYDASLGARSNETSGVAIAQRKQEGNTANLHFQDNRSRSIAHAGRVILSMAKEVYDTPRVMRIINAEEKPQSVAVNGAIQGFDKYYDINSGEYDVAVVTGPAFSTRKEEAFSLMTQMAQAYPPLMQMAGDIIMKNSDVPGAEVIAERMRKAIPPNLIADSEKEESELQGPQVDPEKQQMMQLIEQGQAAVQELQGQLQQAQGQINDKQAIEAAKIETERMKLALEQEKVNNDRIKLALEEKKIEIDTFKAYSDVELAKKQMEIQVIQSMQEREEMKIEENQQSNSVDDSVLENDQYEEALKANEIEQQKAMIEAVMMVKNSVDNLSMSVSRPVLIRRGDDGKISGVE